MKETITLKTDIIVGAYNVIDNTKLTGMTGTQKIEFVKLLRALTPVAKDFDDFRNVILDKMKGDNHDEIITKLQKWRNEKEKTTLTEEERATINAYLNRYEMDVNEAMKSEAQKTHDIEFTPLSAEAFEAFAGSAEITTGQLSELYDLFVIKN